MRKSLIVALAAVAGLGVAGLAYAANVYTVDGSTSPSGKGSASRPKPLSVTFSYTVADEVAANRGLPVKQYRIGAEGLVTYPEAFPTCSGGASGANNPDPAAAARACRKARVGGGVIASLVGPANAPTASQNCVLDMSLYNLEPGNYGDFGRIGRNGGLAIRIDGDPPAPPNLDSSNKGQCLAAQHQAILAPYVAVRIGGVAADELRFTVPDELVNPAPGLDATVRSTFSRIAKKTAKKRIKGKRRTVGFYSAVGCKGGRRSLQVTFVAGDGQRSPERTDRRC